MAIAFFDFDGTLVSSDVVGQYVWLIRRAGSLGRLVRLVASAPGLWRAERQSRERFNRRFYAEYRGFTESWLRAESTALFAEYLRPRLHAGVAELIASVKEEGFTPILVTGGLDFAMQPVQAGLGFIEVIANRLEFQNGVATGRLIPPVLAGAAKVEAMRDAARRYNVELVNCRAYSDDLADLPMLEAVGQPFAAHPKRGLRVLAQARGWTVLDPPYRGRRA